jgi:hypothetical protein
VAEEKSFGERWLSASALAYGLERLGVFNALKPAGILFAILMLWALISGVVEEAMLPTLPQWAVPPADIHVSAAIERPYAGEYTVTNNGRHPIQDVEVKCVDEASDYKTIVAERLNPGETASGSFSPDVAPGASCGLGNYIVVAK